MPAKPRPNAAETVNSPTSSWVNMNATMARIWNIDPVSAVLRPPMRSEIQPQNWRLTKAVPNSTDSIAAPCETRMPRSLHNAGKCACGIAIGIQQKMLATPIRANTRLGGQPITVFGADRVPNASTRSGSSGGARRNIAASGTITTTWSRPK